MRKGVVVALAFAAATARAQDQAQQAPAAQPQAAAPQEQQAPAPQAQPAPAPQAQQAPAPQAQAQGRPSMKGTSDAFDRACVDLMNGKTPQGEQAMKTLRDACASLMSGRVDEKIQAEHRRQQQLAAQQALRDQAAGKGPLNVQPGQATAAPQPGGDVAAAFGTAAGELTGKGKNVPLGMKSNGRAVDYTVVTNPVSWFTGLGINATVFGAFDDAPKFSWVGGLRYSATDTSDGSAIGFGALAGADLFLMGQHNEGLRLGPRVEIAGGRERFNSTSSSNTFARMGLAGELGYNFISSNGITALAAVGLGGRVAGNSSNNNFSSFIPGDFGPYLSFGVGWSW